MTIVGGGMNSSPTSDTTYAGMMLDRAPSTDRTTVQQAMPVAGSVSALTVRINAAPGTGMGTRNWTFAVEKNGTASATVTCEIEESATQTVCVSGAGSLTFAAGDLISVRVARGSSSNANPGSIRWTAAYTASL